MTKTKEKHVEKYVTESMLEKALLRFGENFRKEIRYDTKEIVDAAIDDFAVLSLKHFDRLDKKIDSLEVKMDERFEGMEQEINTRFENMEQRIDVRFENMEQKMDVRFKDTEQKINVRFEDLEQKINVRFDNTNQRIDGHILNCVDRNEYGKLEKRVRAVEVLKQRLALN